MCWRLNVKVKFKLPSHKNVLWSTICSRVQKVDLRVLLSGEMWISGPWRLALETGLEVEMKWLKLNMS